MKGTIVQQKQQSARTGSKKAESETKKQPKKKHMHPNKQPVHQAFLAIQAKARINWRMETLDTGGISTKTLPREAGAGKPKKQKTTQLQVSTETRKKRGGHNNWVRKKCTGKCGT